MVEGGAGDVPGGLSLQEHRLMAEDDAAPIVDRQAAEPTGDNVASNVNERRAADEVTLVGVHGEAQACLVRVVLDGPVERATRTMMADQGPPSSEVSWSAWARKGCSCEGHPLRTGAPA